MPDVLTAVFGEVLSALLTAIFLLVDLTGESASGVPWQLLALVSLAAFCFPQSAAGPAVRGA